MGQKGNLVVFEGSSISEIWETTATKIGMHACYISPYLHEFLGRFRSIKFFDDHGLYSMGQKGNLVVFEGNSISETGEATPTKICVHARYINPYLHEFFVPIPIN